MAASEYLPGSNLTWMALFSQGVLVAAAARERLEYVLPHVSPSGITGAPAVSRTVRNPELEEIGEAAVRAIDSSAHGVYFVDFKGDNEDRPMVTEINGGRCGTTIHFYTEAGCNFPMLLVQLANEGTLEPLPNARRVIEFLHSSDAVTWLSYPELESHPDHRLAGTRERDERCQEERKEESPIDSIQAGEGEFPAVENPQKAQVGQNAGRKKI